MKNTKILRLNLQKKFKSLEYTRSNTDLLFQKKLLTNRDVNQIYEGLFLSAHIGFENFLKDIFLALLIKSSGYKSIYNNVNPRIEINSYPVAYDILKGPSRNFIKWTPFNYMLTLANVYFTGGRPFSSLDLIERNHLKKCTCIRNVIAHKNKSSLNKFYNQVIGNANIPTKEKQIAFYLRGVYRITPIQTRYENLLAELLNISIKIAG